MWGERANEEAVKDKAVCRTDKSWATGLKGFSPPFSFCKLEANLTTLKLVLSICIWCSNTKVTDSGSRPEGTRAWHDDLTSSSCCRRHSPHTCVHQILRRDLSFKLFPTWCNKMHWHVYLWRPQATSVVEIYKYPRHIKPRLSACGSFHCFPSIM